MRDFTNYLNVFRYQNVDKTIPNRVKMALTRKITAVYTDPTYQEELDQIDFDTHSKVMADMVHYGNMNVVSNKIDSILTNGDKILNVNSMMRLLD